jgi:hypothetical protein
MATPQRGKDRRIVLWVAGGIFVLILLFSIFGPSSTSTDQRPTSENAQNGGIKAAYLLLSDLGYATERWNQPETELKSVDPAHTTLILTEPTLPLNDTKMLADALADFLSRGGRVVATGRTGARLLPGGITGQSSRQVILPGGQQGVDEISSATEICQTTPEGSGALARSGAVTIEDDAAWTAHGPQFEVAQRCGPDAVVVSYRFGQGRAIWWSSPLPMTNLGLSTGSLADIGLNADAAKQKAAQAANLRLLLASIGPRDRKLLFDEYLHTFHQGLVEDQRHLPWWAIFWQCVAVALLLLFSFSRRNGPMRLPVAVPRTSPIEFALSMGHLYQKAGSTQAAIGAAHGRLLQFLREQCGLPPELLRAGPAAIAEGLRERLGGEWSLLQVHLEQVKEHETGVAQPKAALKLVQALEADQRQIAAATQQGQTEKAMHRTQGRGAA